MTTKGTEEEEETWSPESLVLTRIPASLSRDSDMRMDLLGGDNNVVVIIVVVAPSVVPVSNVFHFFSNEGWKYSVHLPVPTVTVATRLVGK